MCFSDPSFLSLITTRWTTARGALLHAQQKTKKRGLSAFIFDGGPAYPWRQGVEFELAAGSVGVVWTRAGGGRGCRRCRQERSSPKRAPRYLLHVGGTFVAPQCRQAPAGRSEHDAGLLCSRRAVSKDARRNSRNAKDSVVPQLATERPRGDGRVVTRAATVAMATFPIKPYNKLRAVNGEEPKV